jgi:hypothetical protein
LNIHWANQVSDDWPEIRAELERGFEMSRAAAQRGESFVYVVSTNDLLGRGGVGNAMVATGLLSAARTAALEGWAKGWTVNVIAWDGDGGQRDLAATWAEKRLDSGGVTGELIRVGSGHIGKALP